MEGTSQHLDTGIAAWMKCVTVNLYGRYFTTGGHWYCSLNELRYSEHYMEVSSQHLDTGNVAWMKCVTVYLIWKVLHSSWTLVLELEWSALQWTLYGRYFKTGGHWYCSLNEVRYSDHYMEATSQQLDTVIADWLKCVTVNIIWKILHNSWTLVLQLEWRALQWIISGRYFITGGHFYCRLNKLR